MLLSCKAFLLIIKESIMSTRTLSSTELPLSSPPNLHGKHPRADSSEKHPALWIPMIVQAMMDPALPSDSLCTSNLVPFLPPFSHSSVRVDYLLSVVCVLTIPLPLSPLLKPSKISEFPSSCNIYSSALAACPCASSSYPNRPSFWSQSSLIITHLLLP